MSINSPAEPAGLELEEEPEYLSGLFGDQIQKARDYVRALARDSDRLGLLGPREFPRIWSRHVAHCALMAELIEPSVPNIQPASAELIQLPPVPSPPDIIDVGSGAGLPGIPLAIALPGRHITLLEPMERRAEWLVETVRELSLDNVEVVRARAEEHGRQYRLVTARAVAPLRKLIPLVVPLLSHELTAELLFIKGENAEKEILDASKVIQRAKLGSPELLILGRALEAEPLTAVRITRLQ